MNNEIKHHGIKGMRWGVRRYQSKDGSLTSAGRKRQSDGSGEKKATSSSTKKKDCRSDSKYSNNCSGSILCS